MLVGPYAVEEEIARGGMGVVYRARDTRANRQVALKLLQVRSQVQRARFTREVDALMRLRHRYVVSAHAAGEHRGHPYLVLDLVAGESLQARLDRGGVLEPEEAADLVRKLAQAVAYAHSQGVLHRDIKPANVLLDEQGEPRLTDFGLAKLMDGDAEALSETGMSLGTPGFWAPEQASGELGRIGPATDVYGLGATLYAALLGRPPVEGGSFMELVVATRERRPERPGVDRLLDRICLRCLEKEPSARYASAGELEQELLRWAEADPRAGARRSALFAAAAAAALLTVGLLLVVFLPGGEKAARPPESGAASPEAVEEPALPQTPPVLDEESEAQRLRMRGEALLKAGEIAEGLADLDRAVDQDPGNAAILTARGLGRVVAGRPEEARADLDLAMEYDPSYARAWAGRAFLQFAAGRLDEAFADADRAVALDPRLAQAYVIRANVRHQRGNMEGAVRDLSSALALDPMNTQALHNRGMARMGLGEIEAAVADFTEAVEVDPSYYLGYSSRGLARARQDRYAEALADYDRALELMPPGLPMEESLRTARHEALTHLGR